MKELKELYNGIMNDYSIRKYTTGWKEITSKIEKRFPKIKPSDIQFENHLITNALLVAEGSLLKAIETFAKEMSINLETLRSKI